MARSNHTWAKREREMKKKKKREEKLQKKLERKQAKEAGLDPDLVQDPDAAVEGQEQDQESGAGEEPKREPPPTEL